MILTYTPGEGDVQRWEFQLGKFRVGEQKAIQLASRMPFGSVFKKNLINGDVFARQALLWVLQRRLHSRLQLADVDFADDELVLEFDRGELQEMLDALEKGDVEDGASEAERVQAIAAISAEIARLDADRGDDGEGEQSEGKATLTEPSTSTG
jgi:hypothetical protein